MGDLSKHFSRHEFACRCSCGLDTVDVELLQVLEGVSVHFGAVVNIHSGCRCPARNASEGGADDSQHLVFKAADIDVAGVSADRVADYLDKTYPNKYGIGRYIGRTHIDVRRKKARWDFRGKH